MVSRTAERAPTASEAAEILADTARAVKVMKASWLHVALNLKKIRRHELWKQCSPPCASYEEYTLGVLKLNKHVARRMLEAMEYTEEHRPQLIEEFRRKPDRVEVPSYEVVNQLRRVEEAFGDRRKDLRELRSRVYDEGIGRVILKREITDRLGRMETGSGKKAKRDEENGDEASLGDIIERLMEIESQLRRLRVSKESQRLAFRLVESLQREFETAKSADPGAHS